MSAELRRPARLRAGDRVAVVAPSGPVPSERLTAGVAVLRGWGLDVQVGPHVVGGAGEFAYLAASDADRAADFVAAWCDPGVRAVIAARGGYGVQRIVDLIDWPSLAAAGDKVLLGFSDITALHLALARRLGLSGLHGPVVTSLGDLADAESREHLRRTLLEPETAVLLADSLRVVAGCLQGAEGNCAERVGDRADAVAQAGSVSLSEVASMAGPATTAAPAEAVGPLSVSGPLAGGNLTLISTSIGTADAPDFGGAIVVLEDVNESAYRIDRLLSHLVRSGLLHGATGVVLGTMIDDEDVLARLVGDRLGHLAIPAVIGAPVGHGVRNYAFPLGRAAVLDTSAGTLRLAEPALA